MAKQRGKNRRGKNRRARKATKRHGGTVKKALPFRAPLDQLSPTAALEAAVDQKAREAVEFEKRRLASVEKAALDLDALDSAIMRYHLQFPSLTQEQLGNLVGLGREAVNARMNAPKFTRALTTANRSAIEIFNDNKRRAAVRLGQLIDDPDNKIAIRASIAHMWPHIHGEAVAAGNDFVTFLQEAYERAGEGKPPTPPDTGAVH